MEQNKIYNEDNAIWMPRIASESVDVILTDPPYLYLKNQKLDVPFNETAFFSECKRVLKKDGFIVLFGRGISFYRWNTMLSDLGFNFKEEIVWNKSYCSSPLMPISRVHETVSISSKGNGSINKVKVPYLEMKGFDLDAIKTDINRLLTTYSNESSLLAVKEFLYDGKLTFNGEYNSGITITGGRKRVNRCVSTMNSIKEGMNEKSIIRVKRDHYNQIHPTQKPVRLLERILNLVAKHGNLVIDPFSGSGSTSEACINLGLNFLCCEKDKEYYDLSVDRIKKILIEPKLAM